MLMHSKADVGQLYILFYLVSRRIEQLSTYCLSILSYAPSV
jgi:hypothetical protein